MDINNKKPTREERIKSLKGAIISSEEYEETYTKELQGILVLRQQMKDKLEKIKAMSDEEYENQPL